MLRLVVPACALTLASAALAFTPAPLQKLSDMVIQVREACGAGMHRVNGVCVRTAARRNAGRAVRRGGDRNDLLIA
jgi:hypothetical protein